MSGIKAWQSSTQVLRLPVAGGTLCQGLNSAAVLEPKVCGALVNSSDKEQLKHRYWSKQNSGISSAKSGFLWHRGIFGILSTKCSCTMHPVTARQQQCCPKGCSSALFGDRTTLPIWALTKVTTGHICLSRQELCPCPDVSGCPLLCWGAVALCPYFLEKVGFSLDKKKKATLWIAAALG